MIIIGVIVSINKNKIIDSIIKGIYKKQNIDSKKAKDKSEYTEEKPFLKVLKSNDNFKDNN